MASGQSNVISSKILEMFQKISSLIKFDLISIYSSEYILKY